jgi:putative transcriptional regulator
MVVGVLGEGAWAVCDSLRHDPFADDPDDLWYAVLRRQSGDLRRLALLPEDVSVT